MAYQKTDPPELWGEFSPEQEEAEETPEDGTPEEESHADWDGNEAELVADEDAAEYEEQNTGIQLSYVLKEHEILECLKSSGMMSRTTGKRAVIETIILGVLAVVFFVTYLVENKNDPLFFSGICLLVIAIIWIVPQVGMRRKARSLTDGKEIKVVVYPDVIEIGENEGYWEIPLDGSCVLHRENRLLFLYSGSRALILPLRSIEPAVLADVEARILAGSRKLE